MKMLVFGGSGKIGRTVAWDLARDAEITEVAIVGRNPQSLSRTREWINNEKVTLHPADIFDRAGIIELMKGYDVGVLALPDRRSSYKVVDYAIDAGLDIVDMLEEYHRRPDAYEIEGLEVPEGMSLDQYGDSMHERALRNGVTFLDGLGFAPGLSNVVLGQCIREVDEARVAIARVGGNPAPQYAERHPLKYMITWAFEHVLREYSVRLLVIKNGEVREVEAGSDRETFSLDRFGRDEVLECAVTPGMPSFIYTRSQLREFAEKTIRWPGHWQGVQTLRECGLLDLEPVLYQQHAIIPRAFLSSLITPKLQPEPGETDVSIMYNTMIGEKDGKTVKIETYMWDEADPGRSMSSMMRTTAFPVAIGARLLGRGKIAQKGIVPPEDAIYGENYQYFMDQLRKRNILVNKITTTLDA